MQAQQRTQSRHGFLIELLVEVGEALRDLGEHERARKTDQETLELMDRFWRDYATVPDRLQQASVQAWRGKLLMRQDRPAESLTAFQDSARNFEELLRTDPANSSYRRHLGACRHNVGRQLSDLGRYSEAAKAFRQAVADRERLVRDAPANLGNVSDLGGTYHRLADALEKSGQEREALTARESAVALQRKVWRALPGDDSRRLLRGRLLELARLQLQRRQLPTALGTVIEFCMLFDKPQAGTNSR